MDKTTVRAPALVAVKGHRTATWQKRGSCGQCMKASTAVRTQPCLSLPALARRLCDTHPSQGRGSLSAPTNPHHSPPLGISRDYLSPCKHTAIKNIPGDPVRPSLGWEDGGLPSPSLCLTGPQVPAGHVPRDAPSVQGFITTYLRIRTPAQKYILILSARLGLSAVLDKREGVFDPAASAQLLAHATQPSQTTGGLTAAWPRAQGGMSPAPEV